MTTLLYLIQRALEVVHHVVEVLGHAAGVHLQLQHGAGVNGRDVLRALCQQAG